jgi:hypothetical protein
MDKQIEKLISKIKDIDEIVDVIELLNKETILIYLLYLRNMSLVYMMIYLL